MIVTIATSTCQLNLCFPTNDQHRIAADKKCCLEARQEPTEDTPMYTVTDVLGHWRRGFGRSHVYHKLVGHGSETK